MYKKITILLVLFIFILAGCAEKKDLPENIDAEKNEPEKNIEKLAEETEEEQPFVKEFEGSFIVSVDNHRNAYPQSGLDKADQVMEIMAEGGITRFLAFFDSYHAEKIGPVRSARYYFVQIAKGYPSGFAHAGGNTDALYLIPELKIMDIDEIYNSGAAFFRTNNRKPPHNLYTSTELLLKNAVSRKFSIASLPGLPVGEISGGEKAEIIDIPYSKISSYYHVVTYIYEEGKFWRYVNGKPFETDQKVKISADNVIIMEAPTRSVVKEEVQSEIKIIGTGKALFFINGMVYEGTWSKDSVNAPFSFYYNDELMLFKEGKTWIQVVSTGAPVSYSVKENGMDEDKGEK